MNKQEIEKAIKVLASFDCTDDIDLRDAVEIAVPILEHQLTNGWISVSERLPEQRQHEGGEPVEFNVMLLGGIVPTTGCINNEGIWGWMDWEDYKFTPIGVEVLYWRPLPEPPKEVSQ